MLPAHQRFVADRRIAAQADDRLEVWDQPSALVDRPVQVILQVQFVDAGSAILQRIVKFNAPTAVTLCPSQRLFSFAQYLVRVAVPASAHGQTHAEADGVLMAADFER